MLIFILSYLGGLLTIFSPCVLPVLPFIFARSGQAFRSNGLPILLGMAATFTVLASLAAVGGAWLVAVNQYGRYAAMGLLLLLGLALIFPALSDRLMRPFVAFGSRLQARADAQSSAKSSLLLGVAVGFLWAPCAGPILGLVLAGAALQGANLYSALLLLVFAAGAATSLGLALLAGGRVFAMMKRGLGAEEWLRRGLGVLVVVGVIIIALGWDTKFLAQFSFLNTAKTEQQLIGKFAQSSSNLAVRSAPELQGATQWLNSPALNLSDLRGKVVLVDFWTYSCINCLRTLPYLKAWDEKYRAQGLVIIGVHAPEFAFEKNAHNVEQAVRDLDINYPVAMDNNFAIWNAYKNEYWPAHYLIDAQGQIREQHFGEGNYQETEQSIQKMLKEIHPELAAQTPVKISVAGVAGVALAAQTDSALRSPETYLGNSKQKNFASPETILKDAKQHYSAPKNLALHHWALSGDWLISAESAALQSEYGALDFNFYGRDVNLVMGAKNGKPVRYKITLDGVAPDAAHGMDSDAQGNGAIAGQRLYQLLRLPSSAGEHHLHIEFLDSGAEVFAFTFG